MIQVNTYALSDSIASLRQQMRDYEGSGVVLDATSVTAMTAELKELQMAARRLENELSRLQWNEKARNERRAEQSRAQVLLDALQLPNTNVALLPVVPRPHGGSAA